MQKIPTNLLEATRYFANEQRCIDLVASLKWADGKPICPKCGASENGRNHYWLDAQKRWKCYACRKQFSVKVNTIFEDSPISLDKWLVAMWMLVNCKNGISSHEISRDLKITQKSAWHVLHRLRHVLATKTIEKMGGDNGGPCEADEAFYGPNTKMMHRKARLRSIDLNGHQGRAIVMGVLDRKLREVRAHVVPNIKREVVQEVILNQVSRGATIYTDNAPNYDWLEKGGFVHETVNHVREYVRGEVHTNSLENFWSLLKRQLRGTYISVEPYHLDKYVTEQCFRYNYRNTKDNPMTDADRFALAVSQISGKRLTFAELTGKVPPSF
jgi:transposase-like protein